MKASQFGFDSIVAAIEVVTSRGKEHKRARKLAKRISNLYRAASLSGREYIADMLYGMTKAMAKDLHASGITLKGDEIYISREEEI